MERKVRELRAQDWGVNRIARELGIGSGTVRRIAYEGSSAEPSRDGKSCEVDRLFPPAVTQCDRSGHSCYHLGGSEIEDRQRD